MIGRKIQDLIIVLTILVLAGISFAYVRSVKADTVPVPVPENAKYHIQAIDAKLQVMQYQIDDIMIDAKKLQQERAAVVAEACKAAKQDKDCTILVGAEVFSKVPPKETPKK